MRKLFLFAFACITVSTGCQKEFILTDYPRQGAKINEKDYRVKTYTERLSFENFETTEKFNLKYDSQNRLILFESESDPGNKYVFSYPEAKRYVLEAFVKNELELHM